MIKFYAHPSRFARRWTRASYRNIDLHRHNEQRNVSQGEDELEIPPVTPIEPRSDGEQEDSQDPAERIAKRDCESLRGIHRLHRCGLFIGIYVFTQVCIRAFHGCTEHEGLLGF